MVNFKGLAKKELTKEELKGEIIRYLRDVGIIDEEGNIIKYKDKDSIKNVYYNIKKHFILGQMDFILDNVMVIDKYLLNGKDIDVKRIDLELRDIETDTDRVIAKWFDIVWWSIPYRPTVGRRLSMLLWDRYHNAPFGLITLQSPVISDIKVRDKYYSFTTQEIKMKNINKIMDSHRIGAFPPYNYLTGGKMVAMAVASNEVIKKYKEKYYEDLIGITTMSAFGRSSIYNRLKYKGEYIARSIGYSSGYGNINIPDDLYNKLIKYLNENNVKTKFDFNCGSSVRIKLIRKAFSLLGLGKYSFNNIKKEVFVYNLVKNLKEVIINQAQPIWYDRPFYDLFTYWLQRWCFGKAERDTKFKEFNKKKFYDEYIYCYLNDKNLKYIYQLNLF